MYCLKIQEKKFLVKIESKSVQIPKGKGRDEKKLSFDQDFILWVFHGQKKGCQMVGGSFRSVQLKQKIFENIVKHTEFRKWNGYFNKIS